MSIEVTVGVCLRNCEKDVIDIIDRILAQDYPHENMEVLFVEEGSVDNTLSRLVEIAPKMDINHKIFHHEWKGLGFSRNFISKNARGNYILWIDDGTFIPSNYIEKQVDFMETRPDVGIATGLIKFMSGLNWVATLENIGEVVYSQRNDEESTTRMPAAGGSIYRVKAIQEVGGFDENIKGATEDTDIAYRIMLAGWKISISKITYSRDFNNEFRKIWNRSIWYGYGAHYLLQKHKELRFMLYKSVPLAGLLEGLLISIPAYRLTNKKLAFLLPIYTFIKRLAWSIGYAKSHADSYGHFKL